MRGKDKWFDLWQLPPGKSTGGRSWNCKEQLGIGSHWVRWVNPPSPQKLYPTTAEYWQEKWWLRQTSWCRLCQGHDFSSQAQFHTNPLWNCSMCAMISSNLSTAYQTGLTVLLSWWGCWKSEYSSLWTCWDPSSCTPREYRSKTTS